jgi:transglutaminase-like putative cysteine protease
MTATAATAATATARTPEGPTPTTTTPQQGLHRGAEIALAVVTLSVVIGFGRLFTDGSSLVPLCAHAVLAHLVAAICRRRRTGLAVSGALSGVALALSVAWIGYWSTTVAGLPTGGTLAAVDVDLAEAWRTFSDIAAPVPVEPGFLVIAAVALWAGAWLADLAAFRLWTSIESLVPATALFVFTALLGPEGGRLAAAALFVGAALTFVLLHRLARQQTSTSWLGSDNGRGTTAHLRLGAALVAAAVVVGGLVGPQLPGSDAEPVLDLDPDEGDRSRSIPSPYVEVRGQLLEQTDQLLLQVRSTERAYWRLTALSDFDGNQWTGRASYGEADGELPGLGPLPPGAREVAQSFDLIALDSIWLPAAYQARELVSIEGSEARWDAGSATLIVPTEVDTSDGVAYEVLSYIPTLDPDTLRAAEGGDEPDELTATNTALPAATGAPVRELAAQVAGGATSRYDAAIALQSFLRSDEFTYDTEPQAGSATDPLEAFLFETRAGFCQQFAAAFAAMARSLGMPTRVAVGFTPGAPNAADPTLFDVTGRYAHAWPEVHFPGIGWVPFEPTPGRGIPGAEGYTGVPEAQDGAAGTPPEQPPATAPGEAPPATPPPSVPGDGGPPTTGSGLGDEGGTAAGAGEAPGRPLWRHPIALALLAVFGAAALVFAVLGGLWATRRLARRRRQATDDPDARVRVAWADALDGIAVLGAAPYPHESAVEFAARARSAVGLPAPLPGKPAHHPARPTLRDGIVELAATVEQADYAAAPVDAAAVAHAVEIAAAIGAEAYARTSRRTRLRLALDPRPPARRIAAQRPALDVAPGGPRIQVVTG